MKLPPRRFSGSVLRAIARAVDLRLGARAVYEVLRAELELERLRRVDPRHRGSLAMGLAPLAGRGPRVTAAVVDPLQVEGSARAWSGSSESLLRAYREGALTPTEVVRQRLEDAYGLARRRPSVGPMHEYGEADALRAAEASTERYRAGVPRGGLDGVPIVIKEEMAVAGFRRQAGTRCLDGRVHTADGTLVEHLKAAGAIVLGTTTMTELGFFPLGVNPHRVMPRNPHHLGHGAGGSSTGTGVAVATGLVPFGIGCDGGGSIRIPASSCGVFGLKPTWGRISRFGEPTPGTVEHYGPLATSPLDLARCVEVASGADPNDPETLRAPPLARGTLVGALARGVAGLRIGILDSEWEDADREVAAAGRAAVDALVREGATLVSLQSDLLHVAPAVGYLVLPMGARLVLDDVYTQSPEQLGADLYVSLTALNRVRAIDYLLAAQLRVGLRLEMQRLFREVDVIVLPTTKSVAPALSDEDFEGGVLDAAATHSQCRYTFLSNLTGHPAATAPVGKSASGLPIGLQVIGDAWDEATVLSVLAHLERMEVARVERPMVHVDPLGVA